MRLLETRRVSKFVMHISLRSIYMIYTSNSVVNKKNQNASIQSAFKPIKQNISMFSVICILASHASMLHVLMIQILETVQKTYLKITGIHTIQ